MTQQFNKTTGERGNALFLILIAVALFAALSYAVTTSGRGSGTIDKEQSLITSSQITQFPAAVRTGVTRMVITGTAVTDLAFDITDPSANADPTIEVFASEGGGVIYQSPPANIGTATDWDFLDAQHATDGWYITGIGTNDQTTGREVIAVLDGITETICAQINRGLGITGAILVEATAVDLATPLNGAGAANNAGTFHSYNADPQAFACVRNGAGANWVYYHALVEQ